MKPEEKQHLILYIQIILLWFLFLNIKDKKVK